MIDAGILNKPAVDYAIGLHVAGGLSQGKVSIRSGGITASCDDFTIMLHGKGGHGSQPSHCISPIQMGVDSLQQIQSYVYNCRQDGDGIVLSFGQFQAGFNPNVIPDTAELKGTLRTYNESKRALILEKMKHILNAVTTCYGGTYELQIVPFAPVCVNDARTTAKVASILKDKCTPFIQVVPQDRSSGSEDFAYFSAAVPSAFYYVGVNSGTVELHHSSDFQWDSAALKYMMPWSGAIIPAIARCIKRQDPFKDILSFCLIWASFIFIFFSISKTQLVTYIAPMFPPAAYIIGWYIYRTRIENHLPKLWIGTMGWTCSYRFLRWCRYWRYARPKWSSPYSLLCNKG